MSKVFQCDRCKTIFEPRALQDGESYLHMIREGKGKADLDLCPNCYKLLMDFLNNEVENKCATCRFKGYKSTEKPCKACCYSHDSCYEKEA